ncbi:hypothetical protein CFD26_107020 [Aspergillus turcosus]|uniref:Uncharacterized protein n=1 Tax=Aspergillus turcosus TaxID=1245748 RepID=A0A3R7GGK4_9EURO|nr:hypothetical protein CFD26_107020 [Aspergillus turcosus]
MGQTSFCIRRVPVSEHGEPQGSLPNRLRAQQATLDDLPSNPSDDIEAWRRLAANNVDVTGRLIGEKQEAQGEEDPVPGGWSAYILVTKVPGTRLGGKESVLQDGKFTCEGYFWTLDRETRDLIRLQFGSAHRSIYSAEVSIDGRGLSCLYWDEDAKRLYVHAHFELPIDPYTGIDCPLHPVTFSSCRELESELKRGGMETHTEKLQRICGLLSLEAPEIRVAANNGQWLEGGYSAAAYFQNDPFLLRASPIGKSTGTMFEAEEACAQKVIKYLIDMVREDTRLEDAAAKENERIKNWGSNSR